MKKSLLLFILFLISKQILIGQTNKTLFLGHSLVNFNMPNMVNKLSIAGSKTFSYNTCVINGSPMLYHWNNPTAGLNNPWSTTLPLGGFEHFIVTEAVPLAGHLQWSSTYRIADSFYRYAKLYNPNVQFYIYETWHCINSGNGSTSGIGGYPCDYDPESIMPWRQRLNIDLPKWEGIADSVSLLHPNPTYVIPAGQALARLTDSINAGAIPGITSITNLFSDDIHLNLIGNYFVACVMYGVIHKQTPYGLPNQLTDEWGTPYSQFPTISQAEKLQSIAWETICNYNKEGVFCSFPLSISNIELSAICNQNETVDVNLIIENNAFNQTIEIEKSIDAVHFSKIGELNSLTINQSAGYIFKDNNINSSINYYRIKMLEENRKIKYSNMVKATCNIKSTISILPNPSNNFISIDGLKNNNSIQIVNSIGEKIIFQNDYNKNDKLNIEKLPNGLYYIIAIDNQTQIKTIQKFLKQN